MSSWLFAPPATQLRTNLMSQAVTVSVSGVTAAAAAALKLSRRKRRFSTERLGMLTLQTAGSVTDLSRRRFWQLRAKTQLSLTTKTLKSCGWSISI